MMAGEGEGMVAIVRGLQDAGLTVTLMGDRRHGRRRSSFAGKQPSLTHAKSSVETSTAALLLISSDAGAQVCDGRYTSTYQLAHCRAIPSSPPVESTEFPPQRVGPCRTQGNFEIGGFGSGEVHPPIQSATQSATRSRYSMRNSYTFVDRELLSLTRSSRCTGSFIHSLRRYPSLSPNRSISAELVQRLLTYTQAKNFPKNSHHSKSMRSLNHKSSETTKEIPKKTSKSVQTYSRAKKGKENIPEPERDKDGRSGAEKVRSKKSPFQKHDSKSVRLSNDPLAAMYDYLKPPRAPRTPRPVDVRYLGDVTRALKDTLRQMRQDRHVTCPSMQSRYTQHRRQHHPRNSESSDSNNMEAQASASTVSRGVPLMASCDPATGTYTLTCPSRPKICCYCRKPVPCACPKSAVDMQSYPFAKPRISFDMSDNFEKSIEKEVQNWLQDIPVYGNEKREDKAKREDMARELTEKLKELKGDKDFEEKAREEIEECVQNMPMWSPGTDKDQDQVIKEQIVDKLVDKLREIKPETKGGKTEDPFRKEISKWVDNLSFKEDSEDEMVDKQDVVDDLKNRLKPIVLNAPTNKSEFKNALKEEIVDVLQDLPIKDGKSENLNKLADNLASQLQKIPLKEISKADGMGFSSDKLREKTKLPLAQDDDDKLTLDILNCLEDILDFDMNSEENKEMLQQLVEKIKEIQSKSPEDVNIDEIKEEVSDWLNDVIENIGAKVSTPAKNKVVQKLMDLVTAPPKARKKWGKLEPQKVLDSLKEEVNNVLDDSSIPVEKRSEVESVLASILADQVMRGENDEETKSRLLSALQDMGMSDEECEDIASKLFSSGQEMSLMSKTQDSTLLTDKSKSPFSPIQKKVVQDKNKSLVSPKQKEVFKGKAEREILDFVDEISSDISPANKKKIKPAAQSLAGKIGDIVAEEESTIEDKRESMEIEVSKFLANPPIKTILPVEKQANKLAGRLEDLALKTSTPKRSSIDNISFRPQHGPEESTISTIAGGSTRLDNTQGPSNEEIRYANRLENLISDWINKLPIDLSSDENKDFKEEMIKDIAGDIVDRQKYLQLNPGAKTSDPEELEHLKYQVFRWLNKLPGLKDPMPSIMKTGDLMKAIKGVTVPQLIAPSKKTKESAQKSAQTVPRDLEFLQNEITKWFEAIPVGYLSSKNKKHHRDMIKDLAEKLDDLYADGKPTDADFKGVVSEWLRKMLKGANDKYINSLVEGLKSVIDNKDMATPREMSDIDAQNLTEEGLNKNGANSKYTNNLTEGRKGLTDSKNRVSPRRMSDIGFQNLIADKSKKAGATDKYANSLVEGRKGLIDSKNRVTPRRMSNMYSQNFIAEDSKKTRTTDKYSDSSEEGRKGVIDSKNRVTLTKMPDMGSQNYIAESSRRAGTIDKYTDSSEEEKGRKGVTEGKKLITPSRTSDVGTSNLTTETFKKAANVLYDNIENWCEKLPIPKGETPEESEEVKTLKQNLANKLNNVVGDLNMKPEIFNDDSLYEDLLNDEIDDLLITLPPNPELERELPALKEDLIEKIKEAKLKIQAEVAEQAFKQQLRHSISTALPNTENLSVEEQAPFDLLKENVADAYIELRYAAEDDRVKDKLKNKIGDEINKFCDDYLRRYPDTPIDPKKLNKELFSALQNVPVPKDETIQSQVKQVKIKGVIDDWLKEVPLKKDQTPVEQLQKKKIVGLLAKGLHDIEKEKELNPEMDVEEQMQKEIRKWVKKLPIEPGQEQTVDEMVEKLTEMLQNSEDSRRFSISNITRNNDLTGDDFISQIDGTVGQKDNTFTQRGTSQTCPPCCFKPRRQFLSQCVPPFPCSTLSTEDRAHLHRVRERNSQNQANFSQDFPCCCRDASVSPIPIDADSQTDIEELQWQNCSGQSLPPCAPPPPCYPPISESECPQSPVPNQPLSPQIIVKEYYWDPSDPNSNSNFVPCTRKQSGFPEQLFPQNENSWPDSYANLQSSGMSLPMRQQSGTAPPCVQPTPPCMLPQPCPNQPPCEIPSCMSPMRQSGSSARSPCRIPRSCEGSTPKSGTPPVCVRPSPCGMPPCLPEQTIPCLRPSPPCERSSSYVIPRPCMPRPCELESRRKPCRPTRFSSPTVSASSSPFDTDQDGPSCILRPKVINLGSLDVPCSKKCDRKKTGRSQDIDWSINFPQDANLWERESPCPRRRVRSPQKGGCSKENKRCQCEDRLMARRPPSRDDDSMKRCSKCCGVSCPHPAYLFFK